MNQLLSGHIARHGLCILLILLLGGCSSLPTGQAKIDLIDELVEEQEFARIEQLLHNIDTREPGYEALVVRRHAIRPLIAQYEANVIREIGLLEAADEWPQAQQVLQEALRKLPNSERLLAERQAFFKKREARLASISRDIALMKGEYLSELSPHLEQKVSIHPKGIGTRWDQFWHQRKTRGLAAELMDCGKQAAARAQLDLADACFSMAKTLGTSEPVQEYLIAITEQRVVEELQLAERQNAERAHREATDAKRVKELKARYRQLIEAEWWVAARDTLVEIQSYAPKDEQVAEWTVQLQLAIERQVESRLRRGQKLYSQGELHQALAVWQSAAELDPQNPVVISHITRVERFINKLDRLNGASS